MRRDAPPGRGAPRDPRPRSKRLGLVGRECAGAGATPTLPVWAPTPEGVGGAAGLGAEFIN